MKPGAVGCVHFGGGQGWGARVAMTGRPLIALNG